MSRILQRFAADEGHGRIISSILIISFIVVAMIGAFAFIGPGDYAEVSSETKETSGECGLYGDNLLWSIDSDGNLVITGSGPMKDFSITHDIRWGGNTVRTVAFDIVEGGTTTIGEWAFAYCTSLVSVDFGSSLKSIGYAAFMDCTSLKSFSIPDGVESIDEYAFCYCSGPTEFVIPDSVTAIRNYAFFNLTTMETITFGKGITTLDEKAFSSGTTIDSAVGTKFFDENGIQIDFSDTSVFREKKFTGSIRTMSLAPGTFIWDGIIYKASESAGEAYVDGYNSAIKSDATILGYVSIEGTQRKVVSIRDRAFEGCTYLSSVKIPDEIQSMGTYTFKDCNNLESVTLGNSLKSIGTETFKDCTGLTSVALGSSLDNIGEKAFEGCISLYFVSIPDSVTSIGSYAFFNCTNFKGIHFGTRISSIDSTAFSSGESYDECVSTKFYDENGVELNLSDDIVKFRDKMFTGGIHEMIITEPGRFVRDGIIYLISDSNPNEAYVSGCTSAVKSNPIILDTVPIDGVDRTVTYIKEKALYNCKVLISITIADTVKSIGLLAFHNCTNLRFVTLGSSLTTIDKAAFSYCTSLASIAIPDNVTSIGFEAFAVCSSMTSLTFGSKSLLTIIDDEAFDGCESLTSVDIPDSVTTIGKFAFNNCTNMTSVAFGSKSLLTSIGVYAFNKCGLTSIDIPDRVTAIEDGVFCDCTDLTTVTFPDRLESIDDYAFCNCTSLHTIRFGAGIVSIGSNAFCVRDNYGIVPTEFHDADENKIDLSDSRQYKILQGNTFTGDFTVMTFAEEGTFVYRGIVYKISDSNSNQAYVCRHTNAIRASAAIRESVPINGIICEVTAIGEGAFANCKALASITIPDTVKSIGEEAFYGCEGLASVTIPASVESIGDCAFAKCGSLEKIEVEGGNDHYSSIDGVLFDKDVKTLIQYPPSKAGNSYSIPGTVTAIGMQAFRMCDNLISIEIPESVTFIDVEAFKECHGLASTSIPSQVATIPYGAFYGCTSLASVRIPDTVKTIEAYAFADCTGLKIIHFGNGLIDIDPDMFGNFVDDRFTATAFYDENGDKLSIPSDIEKFKGKMFTGNIFKMNMTDETIIIVDGIIYKTLESTGKAYVCGYTADIGSDPTILDSVTFDGREYPVTSINERAFADCVILSSITIPGTVKSIGDEAFYGCERLASVTIPASVESIGDCAFAKCSSLEWIKVEGGNDHYSSIDGVLFDKDVKTLIQYPPSKAGNSYSIPGTVTAIGMQAFRMCDNLISIEIPESVTFIDVEAFKECHGLTSISIPSKVTTIYYATFYGCTGLASVRIPDTVTAIEAYAFADCTGLTIIHFGKSLNNIDPEMFGSFVDDEFTATAFYDENGDELSIPSDIEKFKGTMFTGNIFKMNMTDETIIIVDGIIYKALESTGEAYVCGYTIDIGSDPTILDSVTFDDRDYKVTYIDERAFTHCKVLASITIPDTVRSIEKEAFYRCTGLISVSIPNSVASIGEKAFKDCKSLASVTIPASVESIGDCAFAKCRSLEWIEVESGNNHYSSVDGVLFDEGVKTLIQYPPSKAGRSYSIPDTVTAIGMQAFRMCENLISIAMPESLTFIGAEAFEECRNLASVTIPDTVETIEKYAFADCTGLKTICFGNGLIDVDSEMLGIFVSKGEFTATRFFDENGNELSLSDIEKFKGKTFTGDISEMNRVLEVHTITFFDGTSYWTYIGCVGDAVPRPADPAREGYKFLYWADEDGNEFDWIVPAKDITVTAQWKSVDPSGDDDDDYYPSGGPDHKSGISDGSAKVLIIAACVAAFMALLLAFTTYETKR